MAILLKYAISAMLHSAFFILILVLDCKCVQTILNSAPSQISTGGKTVEQGSRSPQSVQLNTGLRLEHDWECELIDACSDKNGYEAIRALHRQLDDDANGNVDIAESDEFLRDELQYENGYERQKGFHGNDKHITVDELWIAWKTSEVHNWTVEETIEWLVSYVELPQYAKKFQENGIDGATLPRMALNNLHFLSSVLGIKDPIHKQKIALKAMDVVLFGPPKHHNYIKDVLLVFSLVIAIGGCWFAYVQHKYSQNHMRKMMKDMESLQNAEEALSELQEKLDKARQEQQNVVSEKQDLLRRLQHEITVQQQRKQSAASMMTNAEQSRVQELEEELQQMRETLHKAESALESRSWAPPIALQHWLQLTHELELRHYNSKKASAELQLAAAKEGCEKLRKKRSSFMGAFRVAHGSSIDDVDNRILQAKTALSEVTKVLQERLHRWRQIELLCGFPIVHNPGLLHLESLLQRPSTNNNSTGQSASTSRAKMNRSGSEGTLLDEDTPPPYATGIGARSMANLASATNIENPSLTRHGSKTSIVTLPLLPSTKPAELKPSMSSNAILQLTSQVSNIYSDQNNAESSLEEEEKRQEEKIAVNNGSTCLPEGEKAVFTIGDSPFQENAVPCSTNPLQKKMVKSFSQENRPTSQDIAASHKFSLSESCLNSPQSSGYQQRAYSGSSTESSSYRKISVGIPLRSNLSNSIVDEETTDSSCTAEDEEPKGKKKRGFFSQLRRRNPKAV